MNSMNSMNSMNAMSSMHHPMHQAVSMPFGIPFADHMAYGWRKKRSLSSLFKSLAGPSEKRQEERIPVTSQDTKPNPRSK